MKALTDLAYLFGYDSNKDLDEQEYALAILMLLQTFYNKYNTKNPNYYEKYFNKDLNKLEKKVLKANDKQFDKFAQKKQTAYLTQANIPSSLHNKVELNIQLGTTKSVVDDTIKSAFKQLRDSVSIGLKVLEDRDEGADEFSVTGKMNETVKTIKNSVKYGTGLVRQKTERGVASFVYGDEARFKWVCYGTNPCEWCIKQSKEPPRPLSKIPFDHVNGYCGIEPADEVTSSAYKELLGI